MENSLRTGLFGATCSPFILNASFVKHLDGASMDIAQTIKRDLYVDNIMSSVDTTQHAISYFKDARAVMSNGGFNLRSWSSNSTEVMDMAKAEDVVEKTKIVKTLDVKMEHRKRYVVLSEGKLYKYMYYEKGNSKTIV